MAVAPDALDSLLSTEATEVEVPFDDEPTTSFTLLAVLPEVPVDGLDGELAAPPPVASSPRPPTPAPPAPPAPVAAPAPDTPPAAPVAELPQRRALADTPAQWGPRDHPAPVMAPPPPAPLDPPAVTRTRPQGGTGLPPGLSATRPPSPPPASVPTPAAPSVPAAPEPVDVVPERPTHPRVRRWFGRGSGSEPDGEPGAEPDEAAPAIAAFDGAPEGLLDGVEPEPDRGDAVIDPGGIDAAASRLSAGARRNANSPLAVVAALLEEGEKAEAVVQGEYQHRPGVAVLTDRRVIVANDRRWAPDVRTFECDERLVVHGWQDDRRATLVFVVAGVGVELSAVSDRPLARDLAARVRARVAGDDAPSTPSL
ncbi:MAG TPA: hypothetical protein VIY72_05490 [Acidimicrobiales bacterium]